MKIESRVAAPRPTATEVQTFYTSYPDVLARRVEAKPAPWWLGKRTTGLALAPAAPRGVFTAKTGRRARVLDLDAAYRVKPLDEVQPLGSVPLATAREGIAAVLAAFDRRAAFERWSVTRQESVQRGLICAKDDLPEPGTIRLGELSAVPEHGRLTEQPAAIGIARRRRHPGRRELQSSMNAWSPKRPAARLARGGKRAGKPRFSGPFSCPARSAGLPEIRAEPRPRSGRGLCYRFAALGRQGAAPPAVVVCRRLPQRILSCRRSTSLSARAARTSPSRSKTPHLRGAPQKRGVCTRVYTVTPKQAELGSAQGRPCPADQPRGDHRLHPRRGAQPAGALGRARPRRPRPPTCRACATASSAPRSTPPA